MAIEKDIIKKVSAGGVVYHKGRYLTIKWISQGTVELPKGTIEKGENPEQACIREVLEETGYNVRVIAPLTISNFVFDWHDGKTYEKTVHYFLLERIDELDSKPNREENEDFENTWLTGDEAHKVLSFDDMKAALDKAREIIETTDRNRSNNPVIL